MSDKNLLQITPMLQMKDVDRAVRFFVDMLGFHAWVHAGDYAYVQREGAAVRLLKASPDSDEERQHFGPRAFMFYVDVKDIAALMEEIAPRLLAAGLPAGEGPVDQTWGMREWWVPGSEGGFIVFGQEIFAMPFTPPPKKIKSNLPKCETKDGCLTSWLCRLTGCGYAVLQR